MDARQGLRVQVNIKKAKEESLFRLKKELLRMVTGIEAAGKRVAPVDWRFLTGKEPLLYAMVRLLFLAEIMPSTGSIVRLPGLLF